MAPAPLMRFLDMVNRVEEDERHRHGPVDTTAALAVAAAIARLGRLNEHALAVQDLVVAVRHGWRLVTP